MNHIIHFLLLQLDPEEKVKFSNTLIFIDIFQPISSKWIEILGQILFNRMPEHEGFVF
jgi:hypothetical protein